MSGERPLPLLSAKAIREGRRPRICICSTQVPFVHGGAELLVESLYEQLVDFGADVDRITLPFAWGSRRQILESALAWRLLNLTEAAGQPIDLVIATRFPSYAIRHPNKVVWLIHQFRQVYDLEGTAWSDFGQEPGDDKVKELIRGIDRRALGEARRLFTISKNTAQRLEDHLGLEGQPLYPPPALHGRLRAGAFGDYVFSVGRLDAMKRFDLLIRALPRLRSRTRCVLAGEGPERERLLALARDLGVEARVELVGRVSDEQLIELYAGSLAVFYAPYDEDYGYVTLEAFRAGKPVLTASDSGGVLEFVVDGQNGAIFDPKAPDQLAAVIDALAADPKRAQELGSNGWGASAAVAWPPVIEALTATLPSHLCRDT